MWQLTGTEPMLQEKL